MTISLVTGGAGFIGSHLVEALLARGDEVRVLDDFSSGRRENLASIQDQVRLFEGDLRNADLIKSAVEGADLVFHQAAFVSVPQSLDQPDRCLDINVRGTQQLLEHSRRAKVRRVVLASSAAVYGDNSQIPLQEMLKPDPLSPYAASKHITEIFADLFTRQLDLDVVALRYFNVYGPRQNPESDYAAVIPIFIRHLLTGMQPVVYGNGRQSRDFIYISDVVRANLMAAEELGAAGKAFNICSGMETNLLELLEILETVVGEVIHPEFQDPRPGDIFRSVGDPSLAADILKFKPATELREGLAETSAWMKGADHE